MKCKSKITGYTYDVSDGWDITRDEYRVVIHPEGRENGSNFIRLTYAEFIEAFDKVEE